MPARSDCVLAQKVHWNSEDRLSCKLESDSPILQWLQWGSCTSCSAKQQMQCDSLLHRTCTNNAGMKIPANLRINAQHCLATRAWRQASTRLVSNEQGMTKQNIWGSMQSCPTIEMSQSLTWRAWHIRL